MILKKQIIELNISTDFQPVINDGLDLFEAFFGNKIHSVYLCGSVPRGQAVMGQSDVDFTLVFRDDLLFDYNQTIQDIKRILHKKYPDIRKVDINICSKRQVFEKVNEWGFWIKIISICVKGHDLSLELPPIEVDKALIIALNKETMHVVNRIMTKLTYAESDKERLELRRALTKRLIRAMYTLILDRVGHWSDDFDEIRDLLYYHLAQEEKRVRALYFFLENEDSSMDEYLATAYGIRNYLGKEIELL